VQTNSSQRSEKTTKAISDFLADTITAGEVSVRINNHPVFVRAIKVVTDSNNKLTQIEIWTS